MKKKMEELFDFSKLKRTKTIDVETDLISNGEESFDFSKPFKNTKNGIMNKITNSVSEVFISHFASVFIHIMIPFFIMKLTNIDFYEGFLMFAKIHFVLGAIQSTIMNFKKKEPLIQIANTFMHIFAYFAFFNLGAYEFLLSIFKGFP